MIMDFLQVLSSFFLFNQIAHNILCLKIECLFSDIDHPQIDNLIFVTAADCKLIKVLLGLSGHGGKYSCMDSKASIARQCRHYTTYSRAEVQEFWLKSVKMQEFASVIHDFLLKIMYDQKVSSDTLSPEMHLVMGRTNRKLTVQYLASKGLEQEFCDWCNSQGVTQRGMDI